MRTSAVLFKRCRNCNRKWKPKFKASRSWKFLAPWKTWMCRQNTVIAWTLILKSYPVNMVKAYHLKKRVNLVFVLRWPPKLFLRMAGRGGIWQLLFHFSQFYCGKPIVGWSRPFLGSSAVGCSLSAVCGHFSCSGAYGSRPSKQSCGKNSLPFQIPWYW